MTTDVGTLRTEEPTAGAARRPAPGHGSGTRRRLAVIAGLVAVVVLVVPLLLDSYWMLVMTGAVIYSIVTLGLNVLIGRVGMVSLCQFVLAAVGAWVALRLSYGTSIPFPLLLLIAGVVTGLIGVLIGLPALRLSGLHLALITLMAAGAITIVLRTTLFPNGGGGLFGNSAAGGASSRMPRPSIAQSDTAYYRFCAVVAVLMFPLAIWHVRRKPGRAWAAIRQSQATAVAAGVNTVALQAVGVRPGLVHGRRGRSPARRRRRGSERAAVPRAELGAPPRRRADGRGLQHLGSRRGRPAAARPARPARRLGRVHRGAHDPLRSRRVAGADDCPGRHRRSAAEGPGQARSPHRPPRPARGSRAT